MEIKSFMMIITMTVLLVRFVCHPNFFAYHFSWSSTIYANSFIMKQEPWSMSFYCFCTESSFDTQNGSFYNDSAWLNVNCVLLSYKIWRLAAISRRVASTEFQSLQKDVFLNYLRWILKYLYRNHLSFLSETSASIWLWNYSSKLYI